MVQIGQKLQRLMHRRGLGRAGALFDVAEDYGNENTVSVPPSAV
jgi:hypothetical protein